jgi:hypothetical protein
MTWTFNATVIEVTKEHIKIQRDNGEILGATRECTDGVVGLDKNTSLVGKHVKVVFDVGVKMWVIRANFYVEN